MECSPYRLAAMLAAELQRNLVDARGGVPERLAVYPHAQPAVEFCNMAWVGFGPIKPVGKSRSACALSWDVELTMGVTRCYPTKEGNAAPSTGEVDSAARDILDDGEAMRRAVTDAFGDESVTVVSWQPLPPQGGAHGSKMTVLVASGWGTFVEPRSPMTQGDPRG